MSKKRGHAEASGPEGFDDQPSREQQPRKKNKNKTPRQSAAFHQNQAIERGYDHPIIARVAPILTSDKTLNEKHDAIKLMLVRASLGKSSKTIELKCNAPSAAKSMTTSSARRPLPRGLGPARSTWLLQTQSENKQP